MSENNDGATVMILAGARENR